MTGTYRLEGDKVTVVLNGLDLRVNGAVQPMPNPNGVTEIPVDKRTEIYKIRMVGDALAFETEKKGEQIFRRVTSIPVR